MGFSQKTKDELAKVIPHSRCCKMAELGALLLYDGKGRPRSGKPFEIVLGNAAAARKVFLLAKELFHPQMALKVTKQSRLRRARIYTISLLPEPRLGGILKLLGVTGTKDPVRHSCCLKAFVRGAFLGRGSISDPVRNYHLEFSLESRGEAVRLAFYLRELGYVPKLSHRKGSQVVYLKEADQISELLSVMGAHTALLHLENIRIMKDVRNEVNRLVNCETANVDKTVQAAMEQKKWIERLLEAGVDDLPPKLLELAKLRLENPYASLKELGQMFSPPLGKSGVAHRMRRLQSLAEELENGPSGSN